MPAGLTILYPPSPQTTDEPAEEDDSSDEERSLIDLDIVAVHGLNGDSIKTWTEPESKQLWLRDLLPQKLSRARIMTFGYNARPLLQNSVADIKDHAMDLLECLAEKRRREYELKRQLIFVGHSLGGLVIEQTLVIAGQDLRYKDIDQSTLGVIFFGTPHQGSSHASFFRGFAKLPNIIARMPDPILLEFLIKGSDGLKLLDEEFKKLLELRVYSIYTFYETRPLRGFTTLIVDKKSALLAPPGESLTKERPIPVDDNHRGMCRFASAEDKTYKRFLESVKTMLAENEPSVTNEHYLVSRAVNEYFTGRKDIRQRLINCLTPDRHPRSRKQRRFVLHGMGGSGKTQISLKFADECRKKFWGVFWIDASSKETVQEGFMALARGCEQEENVESIITWLSGKDNWLLIMDNADDQFLDISRFFPAGNRGSIVITTRNPDFQRYATVGSYKVDRMHPEDAITLLLKGSAVQDTENAETRKLAREVVDVLGCLALAIIQAAAVLRQQLCSLSGFCELYSKYKQELLESGRPLPTDDYQYSVYTTWEISIKKIQDMTDTHARLALDLLQTFSFMHFEGIHEGLFRRAREHVDLGYWESWDGYVREILFVKYMPSGWDQLLMGKALGLLLAFSLVNIDEDRQVSIHPLVHGWAGHRMSAEERRKYWMIAAATLAMSTNRKRNISEYRHRKVLLPHVEFCLACEDNQLFSEGSDLKGRLDAVFLFAAIYFENGHVEKALNLSLQDLKLKEIMFPPENIARSTTAIMAVTLLSSARRFEEAIELITILVEALGKTGDDKGILLSMNNWAQALASLGRHQQAVDKCKEALDSFERSFGSESHDILETNSIIARSYLAMGRPKEALELAEKVLEVRMKLYQEYNFALVASMEFVAEVQAALKLFIRARKAQEMYLSWLTTIDGRYHPRTIFALNTMADYHSRIGKFMHGVGIRGLICRREVVERSKIAFGMTDPRTIGFMARLAEDYYNGLAFAKAEQLQEQVVKEMVQAFGEDHKEVIESKEFLAQIRSMGRFYRTIYWWVPKPLSGIEFWLDGAGARLFKESLIITGG